MKLLSIKISSVILAVLVLFSTFSFAIEKHYCGDFLVDVSYLGEADKCNDASDVTNKGCDSKITIKKCCKNEVQIIDGQDEIQKVSLDKVTLKKLKQYIAFYASYNFLFQESEKQEVFQVFYESPDIVFNFQSFYEVYII